MEVASNIIRGVDAELRRLERENDELKAEILWIRELQSATAARAIKAEQERDALISAERASVLVADRDTYKAGYEAKTVLIHELVAALTRAQAALTHAVYQSGHTKFCRAYQDIGDCDCWYGEAWALAAAADDNAHT